MMCRIPGRFIWLVSALLLGCSIAATAAPRASLVGSVVEAETGDALYGANIVVKSAATRTGTTTSLGGKFALESLPPGTYTISISYIGYVAHTIADTLLAGDTIATLKIALAPDVYSLNPITVSASRRPESFIGAPAAVSVLEKAEIEARPTLSPTEHLKGLPALDVASTGLSSTRVVARGFNDEFTGRLLTLVDHRIASLPSLRLNAVQLIPVTDEDIENLEVVLGPGSALYGPNAAGGVVHVITSSPFDSKGTVVSTGAGERGVRMGSFRHAGAFNQQIGYRISSRYYRGKDWPFTDPAEPDSLVKGVQSPEGRIDKSGKIPNERDVEVEKISGDARLDLRLANGLEAVVAGGFSRNSDIELTGIGASQFKNWIVGYLQGRLNYGHLFAQAFFNRSDAGDTFNLRNGNLTIENSTLLVAQIQHGRTLLDDRQRFTYGVDVLLTRPRTEGSVHGRNEDENDIDEIGYYLQSESDLSEKVRLVAAARFDDQNHIPDPVISPRAALIFKPNPSHNFRLTYNRAFQTPSSIELFLDLVASPTLGPLPYAVRARGVPRETGFTFKRDTDGGIGGLYMQSPFTPEGRDRFIAADATLRWDAAVALLQAQGIDLSQLPPPGSDQVGTVLKMLDPNTEQFADASPEDIVDIPPSEPRKTTTFEFGYKGIVDNKLLLATNIYYEKNSNFIVLGMKTPSVLFEPSSLAEYLGNFMSAEEAAGLAEAIAAIPVGTISPREGDPADLLLTGGNFGEISHFGTEVGLEYYANRKWTFSGNGSYLCTRQ